MTQVTNFAPHQQRVVEEADALNTKLDALRVFFGGQIYRNLPVAEKDRLSIQATHMTNYLAVLRERIAAF